MPIVIESMGYSDKFKTWQDVDRYERSEYAVGSVSSILWTIERELLAIIINKYVNKIESAMYLDFACGTGRVLSYLAPKVLNSVGIDVSWQMVMVAQQRSPLSKLYCEDISVPSAPLEGVYDLVTAFRFFSNAEDFLRVNALRAIAQRMRPDAIFICNTHTNPLSYKLATFPYYFIMRKMGARYHARYLGANLLEKLCRDVGLRRIAHFGYGFVPAKLHPLLSNPWVEKMERRGASSGIAQRFGSHQLLVCKRI